MGEGWPGWGATEERVLWPSTAWWLMFRDSLPILAPGHRFKLRKKGLEIQSLHPAPGSRQRGGHPADLPHFLFPASCQVGSLTSFYSDCQSGGGTYMESENLTHQLPVPAPTPPLLMEHLVPRTQGRREVGNCSLPMGGGGPRPSWDNCGREVSTYPDLPFGPVPLGSPTMTPTWLRPSSVPP